MKNLNIGIPAPIALSKIADDQVRVERTASFNSWKNNTLDEDMMFAHIYSCYIEEIEGVSYLIPFSLEITEDKHDLKRIADNLFKRESEDPFGKDGDVMPRIGFSTYNLCNHQFWYTTRFETTFVNFFTKNIKA